MLIVICSLMVIAAVPVAVWPPSVAVAVIVTVFGLGAVAGAVYVVVSPLVGDKLPLAGLSVQATVAFPVPPAMVAESGTVPFVSTAAVAGETVIESGWAFWIVTACAEAVVLPPAPVAVIE